MLLSSTDQLISGGFSSALNALALTGAAGLVGLAPHTGSSVEERHRSAREITAELSANRLDDAFKLQVWIGLSLLTSHPALQAFLRRSHKPLSEFWRRAEPGSPMGSRVRYLSSNLIKWLQSFGDTDATIQLPKL